MNWAKGGCICVCVCWCTWVLCTWMRGEWRDEGWRKAQKRQNQSIGKKINLRTEKVNSPFLMWLSVMVLVGLDDSIYSNSILDQICTAELYVYGYHCRHPPFHHHSSSAMSAFVIITPVQPPAIWLPVEFILHWSFLIGFASRFGFAITYTALLAKLWKSKRVILNAVHNLKVNPWLELCSFHISR